MATIRISLLLGILLFLASCYKMRCMDTGFSISYSGFDSTELAVAIVKKYEPTHDFSKLLGADTIDISNGSDSVSKPVSLDGYHDYEITLLHVNRTDRISDLLSRESKNDGSSGRNSNNCYNGWYYSLNGERRSTPNYGAGFGGYSPQNPVITK